MAKWGGAVLLATEYAPPGSIPLAAALSDRIGRLRVFVAGVVLTMVWTFLMFLLVDTTDPVLAGIGVAIEMFAGGIAYGPVAALFAETFPVALRYSGASLRYQLSNAVGGGFAPLIMTSLLASTGATTSVALYVLVMGLITLGSVALLRSHLADARTEAPEAAALPSPQPL